MALLNYASSRKYCCLVSESAMYRTTHGIVVFFVAVPISCRERRGKAETEERGDKQTRDVVIKWQGDSSESQSTNAINLSAQC